MGLKIAGVMFVVMAAITGIFYWYYTDSQAKMTVLYENNAKLETAVAISEQTIDTLQADFRKANEELTRVNQEFAAIREQNRVLSDKLARHDLGVLGAGKPGLVERLVDRGSANAGRCFELLSGAPLTDREKEATDGKSFNPECPWLWSDSNTN